MTAKVLKKQPVELLIHGVVLTNVIHVELLKHNLLEPNLLIRCVGEDKTFKESAQKIYRSLKEELIDTQVTFDESLVEFSIGTLN